ncbi:MAG: histone deacetylase [Thermoanaerobaculia bacterium]|nr:histone deacetylase [Thermoanaerobaculia bacterium]
MKETNTRRTSRIFTHDDCRKHQPPGGFPERVERLEAICRHFEDAAYDVVRPDIDLEAVDRVVRSAHDGRYVDRLQAASGRGDGIIDSADNPLSAGTWDAALAAVGTALAACDWVFDQETARHAFVATRPPGHHATASRAMGFCYFNNVAAAAEHLLKRRDIDRVAVLDFDVHHGNGTQDIFWHRGDVFYLSSHQFPFYPGSGRADEIGTGEGSGTTLNVPLSAGTGDEGFFAAFDQQMLPALRTWRPDAFLVSAGFDAWERDPLGGLQVGLEAFEAVGTRLGALADEVCGGRLVSLLEGGYDVSSLPELVASYCRGVSP